MSRQPKDATAVQRVEDQHGVQVRVAHVEQPVVQVLAVGAERRLARAQAPDHGEAEVEQRDDEHRERQQDRDEAPGSELVRAAESTVGSSCPVTAMADVAISRPSSSAPASPMKSFAGLPVERQEARRRRRRARPR